MMPRLSLTFLLLAAGLALIGYGLMTPAKAWLSVRLLDHAWTRVLAGEGAVRPWPWMDSEPVARLSFADGGERRSFVVMRGVSGAVLAFAPGWHEQTARPGENGTMLISAHRDTHFTLLRDIELNDRVTIQDRQGQKQTYEVSDFLITETPSLTLPAAHGPSRLLLVTCYPLEEWRPNSPHRLVVVADAI